MAGPKDFIPLESVSLLAKMYSWHSRGLSCFCALHHFIHDIFRVNSVILFALLRLCLLKLNDFVINFCIIVFYTETLLKLKTR